MPRLVTVPPQRVASCLFTRLVDQAVITKTVVSTPNQKSIVYHSLCKRTPRPSLAAGTARAAITSGSSPPADADPLERVYRRLNSTALSSTVPAGADPRLLSLPGR